MRYNIPYIHVFLGTFIHYFPIYGTYSSSNSVHEYWRDVNEHNKEVAIQSSHNVHRIHEIGTESVGRSFEMLNEQNEVIYEKHYQNNERNSEKYEDIHEDSGKRSKIKNYGGKRRRSRLSKCINEWILFFLILHCLFAGAILGQHWNPLEPAIRA